MFETKGNCFLTIRMAQLNLTGKQLARAIGVSEHQFSKYVNGKSFPSVHTFYTLAQELGVTMERLYKGWYDGRRYI